MAEFINPRVDWAFKHFFEKRNAADCEDDLFECWIYIIKNMEKLKEMPFVKKYPVFRMLAEIGDLRKLTPQERELYDEDIKVMRDLYAIRLWEEEQKQMAKEKARKDAEKARKKGMEEGIQKGIEKGELSKSLGIAKSMLLDGMSIPQVLKYTGLTLEQINKLKN